jgi:hypothetical protein
MNLSHQFVEFIPDSLEQGVVYVSIPFATVVHLCCCGCGQEVVTPLSPTDWNITFDGVSISLSPSIGNWNFPCESHYFIRTNTVKWAPKWSADEIRMGRQADAESKAAYFNPEPAPIVGEVPMVNQELAEPKVKLTLWDRLTGWLR